MKLNTRNETRYRPMRELRKWMSDRGLTQVELAAILGCNRGNLSRQLSGKRAVSLAMAARMANLTDIPVERLVNTPETARLVKLLGIHREVA